MALGEFFFGRHALRTTDSQTGKTVRHESPEYKDVSVEGVESAKEQAQEIISIIDGAPTNAVVFMGGASEEDRTKSTAEIFGDTVAKHYAKNPDVVVFTRSQIDDIRKATTQGARNFIHEVLAKNSEKKIVITYPLFLKEFSLRPEFRAKKTGETTEFNKALFPKGRTEDESAAVFMKSDGFVETKGKKISGISPQEVALKQIRGLRRLAEFANLFAHERPVILGYISHGWVLDAVSGYLANAGKADLESFNKTGGKLIQSAEIGRVAIRGEKTVFAYRNKEFEISPLLLNV